MKFSLQLIEAITNDFAENQKVGSGGYGQVYRGKYNGKDIAVKLLNPLKELDDQQFVNELRNLAQIKHHNIVELIGYCYESQHEYVEHYGCFARTPLRVLCFEYMHGGSLEKHIRDERHCELDWPTCFHIIKGTCEGLNHLHNGMKNPVLHLDLKPANILLDEDMTAKIADLGSSKLAVSTETQKLEAINGTPKYTPPEFKNGGHVSKKFDVFSLGVTILDILYGTNGFSYSLKESPERFIELVSNSWKGRQQTSSSQSSHEVYALQVKTCVEIALRCVEVDRDRRPNIEVIVHELEELDAKIKRRWSTYDQSKDSPVGQNFFLPRDESGPARQAHERRQDQRPAAGKKTENPENCFGEVVDDHKLVELTRYTGRPTTQEDRAREAWRLMNDDDKKGKAIRYVDFLKAYYGNGQSTLCLVYNATGDTLRFVANHDWYGYIGSKVGYPEEIGNGQWAAFHHVHRQGEPSGSVGAVVYRGRKTDDGQEQDYVLAWSTPWGMWYRNKAYGEVGSVNYFQKHWDEIYVKLVNGDYSCNIRSGGCEMEAQIDKGDSPKYTATIKTIHGP